MTPSLKLAAPTSLDMSSALQSADWRGWLSCPITPPMVRGALRNSTSAFLAYLDSMAEGEERAIANLAGPSIIPASRTLIEAAFIAQAEMNGFPRLPGRIPEVDFLKTGNERTLSVDRWSGFTPTTPGKTPLAGLRRLKAPLNWAPVWRLPKCVVSTDSVIRFNSHLVSELKREGRAAAASNASHLLALAREGYVSPRKDLPGTLAKNAVASLAHVEDLGTELRDRLGVLLAPIAAAALSSGRERP